MRRKAEHLRIVAEEAVQHTKSTLLECVELTHNALPELALAELDTSTAFFGKQLALPLMVTSMSGGAGEAGPLNRALASACADSGVAFAVGSQRIMLRHPEQRSDFAVRGQIPDGVLLGNIGGQQLLEFTTQEVAGLVGSIEADGLCVHLNPAHELAQPEGDRDFKGITAAIAQLCEALEGRVLVKEVGSGISAEVAQSLVATGVRYLDIAGAGGTSWPLVESFRSGGTAGALVESFKVGQAVEAQALAIALGEWGIPTAPAILAARNAVGADTCIIGSGGVRSGFDVAKCIALGADLAGLAYPALKAYFAGGQAEVAALVNRWGVELKAAMLLTGSKAIAELKSCQRVYLGELQGRLVQLPVPAGGTQDG